MRTPRFQPAAKKPRATSRCGNGPVAAATRACVEGLEGRQMFSVTTSLIDGKLFVQGDDHANVITIDHDGTSTFVNGKAIADAFITKGIFVRTGDQQFFDTDEVVNVMATVKPVDIQGQGGDLIR